MAYNTWNNNDNPQSGFGHPDWPLERQTRPVTTLVTANSTASGATSIKFTYAANVAAVGVAGGQFVNTQDPTITFLSGNGAVGFYKSNNTVSAISGNLVTMAAATTGIIPSGTVIAFDAAINYPSGPASTYFADTVLATPTRIDASNNKIGGSVSVGWVNVQKKTNNDGSVRYLRETLIALANPTSSNTAGGNTSWGRAFANT